MARNILNANIAKIIHKVISPIVFDQTLIKVSSTRDPLDSTKRINTETSHACKGFVDNYKDGWANGTIIKISDRKIVIIGNSLTDGIVPEPNDKIIAEGTTWTIVKEGVVRDPAGATYECQSK